MAKLAVLIPVFNAEKYLLETLSSVAGQSDIDFRAIIIDNNSTDDSGQISEKFAEKDNRFKYFKEKNSGIDNALNKGLKELRDEDFVTFLDSDDLYHPERNARLLKFIENNKLDIVACNALFIDEKGNKIGQNVSYEAIGSENIEFAFFLRNLVPTMSQIIVRRSFIEETGFFPNEFCWALDYFLIVTALIRKKRVGLLNEFLVEKRFHQANFGTNPLNVTASRLKLSWRLYESCLREKINIFKALQIQDRRYVNDVQLLRRQSKEGVISGFLEEIALSKKISSCFYDYFNLVSLTRTALDKAIEYSKQKEFNHPLPMYGLAFLEFTRNAYKSAADLFWKSWKLSRKNFPEAINGAAVSIAFFNLKKAEQLIRRCLFSFPDFNDARINLQLVSEKRVDQLRLNGYVSPRSLDYFIYYYG